jgi:RHS repeat-associated protein
MQLLKPYNRMQMQLASISVLSQPPLAAMPQLSEKPHLGFATKKTAWNPGPNVCNFTVTLGLQVAVVENSVRKTYSARYYNPNTGRFMSRDPLDGQAFDPKTLHKYLYAGGDPVNAMDPTGREMFETALEDTWIERASEIALRTYIVVACAAYTYEALKILGLMEEFPAFLGGAGGGFVCGLLAGGYPALHASHCEIQLLARPHWQPHRVHRAE